MNKNIIVAMISLGLMLFSVSAKADSDKHIWGLLKMNYDGTVSIPENECPGEKGSFEPMIEIRNGKTFKNGRKECDENGKQYKVRMKNKDGSEEETYVVFPLTWVGDDYSLPFPDPNHNEGAMSFSTGTLDERTIQIKIPYSRNLKELIVEKDKKGGKDLDENEAGNDPIIIDDGSFADAPFVIDVAEIEDVSTAEFQGSPNDGYLDINILGSSFPNTQAGVNQFVSDAIAIMDHTMMRAPYRSFRGKIRWNWLDKVSENLEDYQCWPPVPNKICNESCIYCHAKNLKYPYDEIIIIENTDSDAVGGRAFIDCPEFFSPYHPTYSENTYAWVRNGKWSDAYFKFAEATIHELGHSLGGLIDEYSANLGNAPPGVTPPCRASDSNCSVICGIDNWVPERGCGKCNNCWYGCYYDDWVRCNSVCTMLNFNTDTFCNRCKAIITKKIKWELQSPTR